MGGDTWETQEFIDVGGKDVEGVTFSSAFDREKLLLLKLRSSWKNMLRNTKANLLLERSGLMMLT
jgi:hypothetical protein